MSYKLDDFRHQMLRAGDVKIHAVVGGDGPPLVLLHGFPQTWWEWHKVMPILAEQHTVVALDLRGAGHFDSPLGGYDKASLAEDVHGVMGALGFDRYTVCGHDIGAMVGLAGSLTLPTLHYYNYREVAEPGWRRDLNAEVLVAKRADTYLRQIEYFARIIRREEAPLVSSLDGVRTLQATLAVKEAAATGHTIMLSE
jgi:pimeloyl-ACP methyl ester carboxylesterase